MNASASDNLELRALMQRDRIQKTAAELIDKVDETRERISPARNLREHFGVISLTASVICCLAGYAIASSFTRR